MLSLLDSMVVALAICCALACFAAGAALAVLMIVRPKGDFNDRWLGLLPLGLGSALAILALALAKWAIH